MAPIPLSLLPDQLPSHPDQCPTSSFYPFLVGHLVHNPKRPNISGTDLSLFKPGHESVINARSFYAQTLRSAAQAILPLLQHMNHVHPYRELFLIASSARDKLANFIAVVIAVNNYLNTIEASGRLLTVVSMPRLTATMPPSATHSRISAIVYPATPAVIEVASSLQPALLPPISDLTALGSLVTTIDIQSGLPTSLYGPVSVLLVAVKSLKAHFNLLIDPIPSAPSDNNHVTVTLKLFNRPNPCDWPRSHHNAATPNSPDSVDALPVSDTWPPSDPPSASNLPVLLDDKGYEAFLRDTTVKSVPAASLLSSGLWQVHPTPVLRGGGHPHSDTWPPTFPLRSYRPSNQCRILGLLR